MSSVGKRPSGCGVSTSLQVRLIEMDGSVDVLIKEGGTLFRGFEPETEEDDGATDRRGGNLSFFLFFLCGCCVSVKRGGIVTSLARSSHLESEGHVLSQRFSILSAHGIHLGRF